MEKVLFLVSAFLLVWGLRLQSDPASASKGNKLASIGMLLAIFSAIIMPIENTNDIFDLKYSELAIDLYDKIENKCMNCSDILIKKDNTTKAEFIFFLKNIIEPRSIHSNNKLTR